MSSRVDALDTTLPGIGGRREVLDDAHVGDIRGALGTIAAQDHPPRRGLRRRARALLAILGPGLIVMVGDNDAGGVATYAQAGQDYGLTLLWTLVLLIPVLIVNQEMVVRLGAVTGVGHARLIIERFGRFWGAFSVGDLFVLNFLTIVTEFIGVSLALSYFGVSKYLSVPIAVGALVLITATGRFHVWERCMFLFVATNFVALPLVLLTHPDWGGAAHQALVPGAEGGLTSTSMLLIIGIVGTTVAPWQLFFQQSNVIDKRITPRWINYERADTVIGSVVVIVGAAALMMTAAFAFAGTPAHGRFSDAGTVAHGLAQHVGSSAGALFAIVLLNASVIGAGAVTLANSYAMGDVFGRHHSLHRGPRNARLFHLSFAGLVALAGAIVLIPHAPLGLMTTAVQALAGILLPSATVFLVLLCNDREILGPWTNPRWLNLLAGLIVGVLMVLSAILTVTTLFPAIDVTLLTVVLFAALGICLIGAAAHMFLGRGPSPAGEPQAEAGVDRRDWSMPPLATLERPVFSRARRVGLLALRGYLLVAVILLIVKAVELGLGG